MATVLNVTALTLEPKENPDFEKFVFERIFENPAITSLHNVWTGITMKDQIVFAGLMGKTGITDDACSRPASGAGVALTQDYWEPVPFGDTIINCQADLNSLFKAYYDKIKSYEERFDITGSDEEKFLLARYEDAITKSILRLAWLGDTGVAEATAGASGVLLAADVKFYDVLEGIWEKIFTKVGTGAIKRYTIDENAEVTTSAQTTLAAGRSIVIFEAMWALADSRLRADERKKFEVSREIFENYRQYLQSKGENFTIDLTQNGLPSLKWNGVDIINMETVWDLLLRADFVDNTTNNAYYLPNRAVLTVPENTPIGTLNDNDFDNIQAWYNIDERKNKMAYGMTLDAKVLEGYMIVVAY